MAQYYYDLGVSSVQRKEITMLPIMGGSTDALSLFTRDEKSLTSSTGFSPDPLGRQVANTSRFITNETFSDCDVLVKLKRIVLGSVDFFNAGPSIIVRAGGVNTLNGYQISVGAGPTYRSLRMYTIANTNSNIGASSTDYLPVKTPLELATQWMYIRARLMGNIIQARCWYEGSTEPNTWAFTSNRSEYSSGGVGILLQSNDEGCMFDFMSVGTDGDLAPLSPIYRSVFGVVLDPSDNIVGGATVRLYDRKSGTLLGQGISGADGTFTLQTSLPENIEVYCLVVDNNGNSWEIPTADRL